MSDALKQAAQQAMDWLTMGQKASEEGQQALDTIEALLAALSAPQPAQAAPLVTDDVVQRFLGWKLPADFSPDCGISFKRVHSETSPFGPQNYEPTGTNLFTAVQAQAMLEHVLEAGLARKPIWTGADEEMFWLNEIEKYQGGSNGPTIKLRAAILAAAPQPAAPSVAERLGVDWPGCNYLNPPGRICTKCGKDHGAYRAKLAEVWHQGFAAGEKWVEAKQAFWQTHEYGDSPEPEPNPYEVKP